MVQQIIKYSDGTETVINYKNEVDTESEAEEVSEPQEVETPAADEEEDTN